ncbi:MAG TPA: hypothetical protein VH138_14230 [Vicinamibacterales bacterium]|jgi:hypothetical protein|nr:hypothetical protein [Vicinamibacterales bacterium]
MVLLSSFLAALLLQAPTPAIKTTIRMSVVAVDSTLPPQADGKPNPYGNFGPLIKQLLTPDGPVTIDYVISADQSRAEVKGKLATLPQGSVVLQKMGEDTIRVLNPSNKTWYEIPASQNLGTLLGTPDVTIEPAKEEATIAGQRAERFRFKETLRVPVPDGSSLPPDFPRDLDLSGDLWSTDAFSGDAYAAVFRTLQAFAAIPGVEALTSGGRFPLRIALRSSIMPGYEIRSEVTAIGPASPDASVFAVPQGYIKVQAPGGG